MTISHKVHARKGEKPVFLGAYILLLIQLA
jgi:hypothetical protein